MSRKVPERIDGFSVTANLEVQHGTALARATHVGDMLAALHFVPFSHVQPLVVGIGTQNSAVVLDDDKLAVADEPAARVDDSPARGGPDGLLE